MKISPDLNEAEKIAATGKYDVIPVSCDILSDFTTPIETMRILKNVSGHCYMLESVQANETWGRYTFLGFDPTMEITCLDGTINAVSAFGTQRDDTDDPSDFLRKVLSGYKIPRFEYLPPVHRRPRRLFFI